MTQEFESHQQRYFEEADTTHFEWQTRSPYFASRERDFLVRHTAPLGGPVLEIGCGEGGNLHHLIGGAGDGADGLHVGIDAFARKLSFARRHVPGGTYASADGGRLPFRDGAFQSVLIRDVLHHLPEPFECVRDACRVLAPGGTFVLIEPNARNPLIQLQMALVPAERGAARSTSAWLKDLLAPLPLEPPALSQDAPFPIDRVVLHPQFGLPSLGGSRVVASALDGMSALAARLMPRDRWSYLILRATRLAG